MNHDPKPLEEKLGYYINRDMSWGHRNHVFFGQFSVTGL